MRIDKDDRDRICRGAEVSYTGPLLIRERTRVVNVRRESYDVYIGRGKRSPGKCKPGERGYFGNPFRPWAAKSRSESVGTLRTEAREACLAKYREWFLERIASDPIFRAEVEKLEWKRLGCFCAPLPCHGDVIARWLDDGRL